jgi:hypothetical protein
MIEFLKESHQYLVDGILVPSVSTILAKTIFKDKYSKVPSFVLERAAEFGTAIHKAIEDSDWLDLNDEQYQVYLRYLKLVKMANIEPTAHEQVVAYKTLFAGTFDMEAFIDSEDSLVDIKTTYNLDIEYLSWQLSMYELAKGKQYKRLYVIWLPKRKGAELIEIPRKSETEIMELIQLYETISKEN